VTGRIVPAPRGVARDNLAALAGLRRQAEDAKVNSPVVPAHPTMVDAAPGHISSSLHPR